VKSLDESFADFYLVAVNIFRKASINFFLVKQKASESVWKLLKITGLTTKL